MKTKKNRLWRIFMNTCLCISIYWQTWGPRASLTGDVDKVTILSKVRSSTVKGAGKQRYLHTHTPHSSFILQSPCGAWIQYIRTTRNWALPLWPAGKSSKPSIPWASSAWNRQCNMWSQYIFRSIKLRMIDWWNMHRPFLVYLSVLKSKLRKAEHSASTIHS